MTLYERSGGLVEAFGVRLGVFSTIELGADHVAPEGRQVIKGSPFKG